MRILRAGGFERVAGHYQQGQGGAETGTRDRGPGADDVRHAKSPQSRDLSGSQKAFSGKSFSQRDSTQRADVGKPQSWTVRARIRVEVGRRRRLSRAGRGNYRQGGPLHPVLKQIGTAARCRRSLSRAEPREPGSGARRNQAAITIANNKG